MTSLTEVHHNSVNNEIAWQPANEHQSLKIFDFHSTVKSKIPILVDKRCANLQKGQKPKKEKDHWSRIPVYKSRELEQKSISPDANKSPERMNISPKTSQAVVKVEAGLKPRKSLKLHGLELTSLPQDLFDRKELETLILSPERESCLDFKLPFLPSAIGRLIKLHTLVLDTNELDDIPDEVGNLQNLETLILGNNNLTNLPLGLGRLDKLKSLHLPNNRFEEMPMVICNLASLRFLDMSDNSLICLPYEMCELAGTLSTLLLVMNQIEFLPENFSLLTSLNCLWLGENNLRELPEDFGELYRLDWGRQPCSSNIDGNPLERPPLYICQQGPLEIRKYFHAIRCSSEDQSILSSSISSMGGKSPYALSNSSSKRFT